MKKRLLLGLLIVSLAATFCACGEQGKKPEAAPAAANESLENETPKQQPTGDTNEIKPEDKENSEKNTSMEVTNSGKYYKSYEMVEGYDIGNTGFIRLDCDPDGGYVQFDLSEWLQPNTFFSTDYLPSDGEYFATTYDYGGGEPNREKIYLEYSDNKIVIYFYSNESNPDTGEIGLVRQEMGSEFKLVEDSRFY